MVSPRIDQTHRGRKPSLSQAWQHSPVIPTLDRLRQEDYKFRSSLYYRVRPCLEIQITVRIKIHLFYGEILTWNSW